MLAGFSNVLCPEPGRTMVLQHQIDTGGARPVRLPPIPHAYRDTVREELKQMEKSRTMERSSVPIVLVQKKDGTLRIVRRLSSPECPFGSRRLPDAQD